MKVINNKAERIRFLKFLFVGITGTIVDFGLMNLMRLVLNIPLVWAQAISFVLAVINNFLWNRYWTYPESRSRSVPKQLIQFFIINLIGLLIRTPLVPWFDNLFLGLLSKSHLSFPFSYQVISQNLALAVTISIIILWNFFANRYWTYNNIPVGVIADQPLSMDSVEERIKDNHETNP